MNDELTTALFAYHTTNRLADEAEARFNDLQRQQSAAEDLWLQRRKDARAAEQVVLHLARQGVAS